MECPKKTIFCFGDDTETTALQIHSSTQSTQDFYFLAHTRDRTNLVFVRWHRPPFLATRHHLRSSCHHMMEKRIVEMTPLL